MQKIYTFCYLFLSLVLVSYSLQAQDLIVKNSKPIVYPVDLSISIDTEKITHQVLAKDMDGDQLKYELVAPKESSDYTGLSINSETGLISLTLNTQSLNDVIIGYVVTDGKIYSNMAELKITKKNNQSKKRLGLKHIDAVLYNSFKKNQNSNYRAILPSKVDLSSAFPSPGNQLNQGSCTAWAVGYAAKSYEEKVEMGWAYQANTLFSPAWIYNQINGGVDEGSYIHEALGLIVNKGAATLATMPYNSNDYWSRPSLLAIKEAAKYKATSWVRLSSKDDIKDKLAKALPVIIGIDIYDSFYALRGSNAVYTPSGNYDGGHAVTVVGYDDNQFGGAYKVINSWGTTWGAQGYFWLPYSVAQTDYGRGYPLLSEAYTLYDAKNIDIPINNNLPNLSITSWSASYSNTNGKLSWTIANTGQAIAPQGWNLNLIISKDKVIDSSDTIVVSETINCCTINPGESLSRSSAANNQLAFSFPKTLTTGYYYMAVQVDSPSKVIETNESDNTSFATNLIYINSGSLPNLRSVKWQTSFINSSSVYANLGKGIVNYQIINDSSRSIDTTFWVGLFLVNNSGQTYLVYANYFNNIPALYTITRSISSSVLPYTYDFNLNSGKDVFGNLIPNDAYKFRFVVDYPGWISESVENDNSSDSLNFYTIPLVNSSLTKKLKADLFLEQTNGGLEVFSNEDADIILKNSNQGDNKKEVIIKSSNIQLITEPKIAVGDDLIITPLNADNLMPKLAE